MQHILVVSQDEAYRDALLDLLRDEGYTVYLAVSVETAVEHLHAQKLDVLIVDIDSWKEEGVGVYKQLHQERGTRDLSCIIVVSVACMKTVEFSLAFEDFIVKGGDPQEVPLRIKQFLWRHSRLDTKNIIKVDNLVIDLNSYEVTIKGT